MFNKATGSDKENDSARHFPELPITRTVQPVRKAMPAVSDMEINLRLNVPDGLATDGSHAYKYVTATTDEHRNPEESPIRREADAI
jgi:hypothetical protein